MWTEPEHLQRWCCPKGFTLPVSEGDISEGGSFRSCMRSPEGQDHWLAGTYRELTRHSKIVFTHAWLDEQGHAQHETLVSITLEELDGKTRLTLHQASFRNEASKNGHAEGWSETLDNLEEYLAR